MLASVTFLKKWFLSIQQKLLRFFTMSLTVYLSIKYRIVKGFTDETLLKFTVQDRASPLWHSYLSELKRQLSVTPIPVNKNRFS